VAPALVSKAYTEALAWAAERLAGD
jgi:hypothetical protein